MTRIVAFVIAVFAACSAAGAAESGPSKAREVHIDVGTSEAPLIVTAQVEDYRATPIDLLQPVATADAPMTQLMKLYFQTFIAGDTKKVASLYEAHMRAGANDYFSTPQTMTEGFEHLKSVRLLAVLHWGEYQFAFVESERTIDKKEDGLPRWSAAHPAHCVGGDCRITDNFEISQLGNTVAQAFGEKGATQFAVPAQGETALPIFPIADANKQPVAIDPIILHLNRASDETAAGVARMLVPTLTPSWTLSGVYSFGSDFCAALLKSPENRAGKLVPMDRAATGWTISAEPEFNHAWWILSSVSTAVALRGL